MASKGAIQKNLRREKLIEQYKDKREKLLSVINNPEMDMEERLAAFYKFSKLPRNSSPIRRRNRCRLTGRPRGYNRMFGISRIALRNLASQGHICGVTKSSW